MKIEKAKQIALEYINSNYNYPDDKLIILEDKIIEKEYGWYFFSSSAKFLETKELRDMVLGNGPILVEREGGKVIQLGTSHPVEFYIELYEKGVL